MMEYPLGDLAVYMQDMEEGKVTSEKFLTLDKPMSKQKNIVVIGISGPARHGKDTVLNSMVRTLSSLPTYNTYTVVISTALKKEVMKLLELPSLEILNFLKDNGYEHTFKEDNKYFHKGDVSTVRAMHHVVGDYLRSEDNDIFCKVTARTVWHKVYTDNENSIKGKSPAIQRLETSRALRANKIKLKNRANGKNTIVVFIPDFRYTNEVEYLTKFLAKSNVDLQIVDVNRPSLDLETVSLKEQEMTHDCEQRLPKKYINFTIVNDSTLKRLENKAVDTLRLILKENKKRKREK